MISTLRNFYGRFERPISSLSLISGFVFDVITLKRVDALWENFWILGHLFIICVFIVLIHVQENSDGNERNPEKAHFWYVNILQFFFGGILSAYLVFYFRSTDIFTTWPFFIILAIAFVANESLKRHYIRFSFQISLFFLSIYSFAIFFVPVLMHRIGTEVFLISGVLSLAFIVIFISLLLYFIKERFTEKKKTIWFLVAGIFISVNLLYFTNLIPPIPLSLKDGGIYHSLQRNSDGNYDVGYENTNWQSYFQLYQNFKEAPETTVYAYSAIFSPADFNLTIFHEWQYYDEVKHGWVSDRTIELSVVGGRDGGFRTYSSRQNLRAGKWRVNILTSDSKLIGRLRLNIEKVDTEPALLAGIKQ